MDRFAILGDVHLWGNRGVGFMEVAGLEDREVVWFRADGEDDCF